MSINIGSLPINAVQDILAIFNGWDLQDASYNGVNFYIANAIPGISNGTINNYAQIINSIENFFNSSQFPLNSAPPLGTNYFLKNTRDTIRRKLIVHPSINSSTNIIEDQGFLPERFGIVGIISGNNYQQVYTNLYNYFLARRGDDYFDNIPIGYQNVLYHPVRGKITNCLLENFDVIHSGSYIKAIVFTASFITQSLSNFTLTTNIANQISQALAILTNSIAAIQNTIVASQLTFNTLSANYNNSAQQQTYQNVIAPTITNTIIPLSNAIGTIMYNNLNPSNLTNYYFQNQTVDYTALPDLVPFSTGFNYGSLSSILSVYETNSQATLDYIYQLDYNYNTGVYDLPYSTFLADIIQSIKNCYVSLYNLAKVYSVNNLNSFISYTLPYSMSLRKVCFLNLVDFTVVNNIDIIYQLNSNVINNVNFIDQDTIIKIPQSLISN